MRQVKPLGAFSVDISGDEALLLGAEHMAVPIGGTGLAPKSAGTVMGNRIVIIQGHPECAARHFCHALADEYAKGAQDASHQTRHIDVAQLDFPLLRTKHDFEQGEPPAVIK